MCSEAEEATVIGNTKEQTLNISLPVTWTEDGQAVVTFTFEFNDEAILTHYPVETWHSGKHTILLYYPIEDVVANYTNTFNVYMKVEGGFGTVDIGGCIASISGQSMGADAAWDGKLEIEESVGRFAFGNGNLNGRIRPVGFTESTSWEINELVQRAYSDVVSGKTAVGAFCMPVDMD